MKGDLDLWPMAQHLPGRLRRVIELSGCQTLGGLREFVESGALFDLMEQNPKLPMGEKTIRATYLLAGVEYTENAHTRECKELADRFRALIDADPQCKAFLRRVVGSLDGQQ